MRISRRINTHIVEILKRVVPKSVFLARIQNFAFLSQFVVQVTLNLVVCTQIPRLDWVLAIVADRDTGDEVA